MDDYSGWLNDENSQYIKVLFGETQSIIRHAEAGVINSGTASLETALFGTPQVVGYIINPLTYWLAKKIIKVGDTITTVSADGKTIIEEVIAEGDARIGCVAVDAELANILQQLMDKYTFEGVENSWLKLCYYEQYFCAATPK
jgi:lipid A disaccharide synthetase